MVVKNVIIKGKHMTVQRAILGFLVGVFLTGCLSTLDPLSVSDRSEVTVKVDFLHRPLPEIPLPNDLATRYDPQSPTKRRINASMIATTYAESRVRTLIDQLDGWGVNQPITIPFTGPIDPLSILAGHRDIDYQTENDVVFLIDVTPTSPDYGQIIHLDVGEGNYPLTLEDLNGYWEHDPRGSTLSLTLDETEEDLNGNGVMDLGEDLNGNGVLDEGEDLDGDGALTPPEDLDGDGVLDHPNYLPCGAIGVEDLPCDADQKWSAPLQDDLKSRADALMTFYERETNTLILRAMRALRERTTYAVVLSKRIKDLNGDAIGSPFESTHHLSQQDALEKIFEFLPSAVKTEGIAFAFTFTTQSTSSNWVAVREGLYGFGVQAHIAERYPAQLKKITPLRDVNSPKFAEIENPYIMYTEDWIDAFAALAQTDLLGQEGDSRFFQAQMASQPFVDYHVIGSFSSPQLYSRVPLKSATESCAEICESVTGCESPIDSLIEGALDGMSCETRCAHWPTEVTRCFGRSLQCSSVMSCITPKVIEPESDEDNSSERVTEEESTEGDEAEGGSMTGAYQNALGQWENRCGPPQDCDDSQQDVSLWQEFNEQSWPNDLTTTPAATTPEEIWFWLMMPREDVRPEGPTPVAIIGHGYSSNRFESLAFAGFFAQHGIATLAIDCPSHGIEFKDEEFETASVLTDLFGITPFLRAANYGRASDQNFKPPVDSGADFWSAYIFHTRDVVRQCVLDYMQLIKILRSFDGKRRWNFDLNGDGEPELAGDFNADGEVDIGAGSPLSYMGASLGGILASLIGSLEPEVKVTLPISGGGGLGDIGVRSFQGGVREAVILRVMGPLFIGVPDGEDSTRVYTLITELNDDARHDVGHLPKLTPYDTILIENLENGERSCAYVQESGTFRVGVESDRGDRVKITAYSGPQLAGDEECGLRSDTRPKVRGVLDSFESEVIFSGRRYPSGAPLVTFTEGFGERRATPGLRRFLGLGQLVLDGGDPATYARHILEEPLKYPLKGDETGAHTIIVTTMGDMNVPASSGSTLGRSAGLIDYLRPLPEHGGKTANQVLLDTFATEAVHSLGRYFDQEGTPVHIDIELFSEGEDVWTKQGVPRLNAPLRSGLNTKDRLGGYSGAIFPYSSPEGQHGFNFPGVDQDIYIDQCESECAAEDSECLAQCENAYEGKFDVGFFLLNAFANYIKSGGLVWELKPCYSQNLCP